MDSRGTKLGSQENKNGSENENYGAAKLRTEKELGDVSLLVQESDTGATLDNQYSKDHQIPNPSDHTPHDVTKVLTDSSSAAAASGNLIEQEQTEKDHVMLDVPSNTTTAIDNNTATCVAVDASSKDTTSVSNPINSTDNDSLSYLADVLRAKNVNVWGTATVKKSALADLEQMGEFDESGAPPERASFMNQLETFHRERALDFKPPKFYGEPLNCLKLWRAVIRLGGYDVVTASKLWRQVGESFCPPKTCTTVSWTFRNFYEKALLEYEKHKREIGELQLPAGSFHQTVNAEKEATAYQGSGPGRARRDAAARAMQGWHAQRLLGYGDATEPVIKDKNLSSVAKREKNLKSLGMINKRMPSCMEHAEKGRYIEGDKQLIIAIVDVGPPADWVKINVRETKDCFEVYALVPGLLREEVRVQSDPAGRLVITGEPEQVENPWGITPFKKVVTLPARIDPLHTSAVVSLHGRLFVRVPFE